MPYTDRNPYPRTRRWLAALGVSLLGACATVGGQQPAPVIESSAPAVQTPGAGFETPGAEAAPAASQDENDNAEVVITPAEPPASAHTNPLPTDAESATPPEPNLEPAGTSAEPVVPGPAQQANPATEPSGQAATPEPVQPQPPTPDQENQASAESTAEAPAASEPQPGPGSGAARTEMDLDGLESRLRQTKAIGLFTKLELKSQVNDLLDDLEDYHRNRNSMSLRQLEEHFNLLVMKLLVLLEKDDPQLHRDIARARPTLWSTLADPNEFTSMRGP